MFLAVCFLWMTTPPSVGARVVLGSQTSEYSVRVANPELQVYDYENNGYLQKAAKGEDGIQVRVQVKNSQLSSKMRARPVRPLPASLASLEQGLNNRSGGYLADQISFLVHWLRHEIDLDAGYVADQSLERVCREKTANCVGLSTLFLHVLENMDVKARFVTGVSFKPGDRASLVLEGNVLHRWVEIYYEDVGWVFCDPAGRVNFVDATYLVLGVQNLHPLEAQLDRAVGARVELLRFSNGFQTVGSMPEYGQGLRIRPNRLFLSPQ